MKKVIFSRAVKPERGIKRFILREKQHEHDNITHIKKTFSYHVSKCPRHIEPQQAEPEVFVKKKALDHRGLEMVRFEVKGRMFSRHNQTMYEIVYHHVLNIHILWKNNTLSPNNTAHLQ